MITSDNYEDAIKRATDAIEQGDQSLFGLGCFQLLLTDWSPNDDQKQVIFDKLMNAIPVAATYNSRGGQALLNLALDHFQTLENRRVIMRMVTDNIHNLSGDNDVRQKVISTAFAYVNRLPENQKQFLRTGRSVVGVATDHFIVAKNPVPALVARHPQNPEEAFIMEDNAARPIDEFGRFDPSSQLAFRTAVDKFLKRKLP